MSSTSRPHLPAPTRRAMLKGAAWGAPAVATTTAAPAAAASVLPDQPTDLAIDVVDPPVDMDTWQPEMTVPVYQQDLRTVAQMASLPPMVRVTNVGSVPAVNPVGTFEAAMAALATLRGHAHDLSGVIVPDCGHFIMEEAAQAFIAELLPFLQRTL